MNPDPFCGKQNGSRAGRTPPYRGGMSLHGCAYGTSTPPYPKGGA